MPSHGAGRGKAAAVGLATPATLCRMPAQRADLVPSVGVPEPRGLIGAGGGEAAAVGAERHEPLVGPCPNGHDGRWYRPAPSCRLGYPRRCLGLAIVNGVPGLHGAVRTGRTHRGGGRGPGRRRDRPRRSAQEVPVLPATSAAFHSLTVLSALADARVRPSRAGRRPNGSPPRVPAQGPGLSWPLSGVPQPHGPVHARRRRRVRPSGLNATDARTAPACPRSVRASPASRSQRPRA